MIRTPLLALALLPAALVAQQPAPACPSTATLPDLIKAVDDAVSGPGNKDRTCMRALFVADARLQPMAKTPDGAFAPHTLTLDDWINAVAKRGSTAFYEVQVKYSTEQYGHIAHLWSTYEIRPTLDGKATLSGINSIEGVNDGTRWRILSLQWEPNTTAGPVPPQYLP